MIFVSHTNKAHGSIKIDYTNSGVTWNYGPPSRIADCEIVLDGAGIETSLSFFKNRNFYLNSSNF